MRRLCWLASVAVLLAGCSTTPTPPAAATPAGSEYLYKNQTQTSDSDARVVIIRDQGFVGAGCRMGFYIDGQRVGDLASKEKAAFYLPAGVRMLGAGVAASSTGLCTMGGESNLRQREATFSPGQERSFRMTFDSNGNLDVLPLAP